MSRQFVRLGAIVGSAALLAAAVGWAQDRGTNPTRARGAVEVFNPVQGRIRVVSGLPEGARVEKGAVVCELDPTELQDRLNSEEIAVRAALSETQAARLGREVAMMSLNEYQQGHFVQDLATVEGEVKLAESDLLRAEDSLEWARRMFDKGYVSMASKVAEELAFKKTQFALEQAQSKRKILIEYTKNRTIKELTGAVESARARELARQAAHERGRSVARRLGDEVKHCKVVAPIAGRIRYHAPIGAGAVLHDGQAIFRIDPDGEPEPPAK